MSQPTNGFGFTAGGAVIVFGARVVAKRGGQFGTLELLETRFHADWYDYAFSTLVAARAGNVEGPIHYDAKSGRPAVYSQMVGHAICGGFSPRIPTFPICR